MLDEVMGDVVYSIATEAQRHKEKINKLEVEKEWESYSFSTSIKE